MQQDPPIPGSLVLYKARPARVLTVTDKIEIELEGTKAKRVRPKDILLLHPGPIASLSELKPCEGEMEEAWALLAGGGTNLPELAELIYGEYVPATAWAAWRLVADGLYFEGEPDSISVRTEEQVASDRRRREEKAAAERDWAEFLERLGRCEIIPADHRRLGEVERLAFNQSKHSRILQALGRQETPENAHRLLVGLGYWERDFNPYPRRLGQPVGPPDLEVPPLPDEERLDLTHLPAFAIDDEGNQDPDDAISLDGDRIWVHVADVAALAGPDSPMDLEARARCANLYLPETTIQMLPWAVTERLGLGLAQTSPALSFGFRLGADAEITDVEVAPTRVAVTRISYAGAAERLHQPPFDRLLEMARRYRERRNAAGAFRIDLPEVTVRVRDGEVRIRPLSRLDSRDMVTDIMLMAGEAAARFALERDIPVPFATQASPGIPVAPAGLAAMYACRRSLKPSQSRLQPEPHAGLGLAAYCRATSPLRRYTDLVVHQQLRAHLAGGEPLSVKEVRGRIGAAEAVAGSVRKAERFSNLHWKLVYLSRHPGWRGEGVVVEMADRRATVIIPELAMETKIRLAQPVALDTRLEIAVRELDLADLTAWFRVLG
ncbi:MAG TPA: RNB domain-containing ribonuclease [Sedimenticola sp.]|nr:RNB domain-containing ribonuclease [Sedimenticola sp.]